MLEALFYKLSSYIQLAFCSISTLSCASAAEPPNILNLNLPAGFEINVFAKLETAPRMLAFDKDGNLFTTLSSRNQVVMLPDTNKDRLSEAPVLISDALNRPNGLVFVGDDLLVANEDGVVKLTKKDNKWSEPQPFIRNLPYGHHTVKTIKLGPDNHLYLNVGSSCNVCVEENPLRATILRYTVEGKAAGALEALGRHAPNPTWATGLRNSQGFAWHPKTGAMFATNNGSDMRTYIKNGLPDDDLPPEHFNHILPGHNYGWPHCWGNIYTDRVDADGIKSNPHRWGDLFEDPNFKGSGDFCSKATPPAMVFESHSTPIGVTFLDKANFPPEYKNDAIVALHGSWNRKQLSGYKLVRVKFNGDKPIVMVDFVTGWLNNNSAWGRPVDVITGPDGAIYVSDDRANYIYRISYKAKQ